MKRIALSSIILLGAQLALGQESDKKDSIISLEPVEVRATRASKTAPFTKLNLSKSEITRENLGQDLPFILDQTPSVVVNSDAGNGIGYTGIRIRGTDATRINVTLNGIPYNDAESQGTFFVDLPDISSSVHSIQIQRGVGTSTNGAGAFGATINVSTNEVNRDPYAELNNSYGSFNTWKNTLRVGSGLLNDHVTLDLRLSNITSDGYIDRAGTNLKSYYFSAAWLAEKSSLRFNAFSGKEKTYQAWYGISQADLDAGHRTVNYAGTEKPGTPYDNETDNYQQDHYQLFFDQQLNQKTVFNNATFLSRGKGYYEQYKAGEFYADYGLADPAPGISTTDLVRQLWLDNYFYGDVFSLQYQGDRTMLTLGGGVTRYDGNHYGDIIWAQGGIPEPTYRWYDLNAQKNDVNMFFKQETSWSGNWRLFYDLQYRHVKYEINGFRDNPSLLISNQYDFFNPHVGISYQKNGWQGYLSYSVAGKEPNRDDFEAGKMQQPKVERLYDTELGFEKSIPKGYLAASFYYMKYRDQLILTGKINDVGAYTRTNVPHSYRMGLELSAQSRLSHWLRASANLALSRNKVKDFTEYIDDYDNGGQKSFAYALTDIAYSPAVVGGATLTLAPVKNLEFSLVSKYVGKQYLDNTQQESRKLDAFFTEDARVVYTIRGKWLKELNLIFQLLNVFNEKYEPNGYTYSYQYGGELTTENYYFPMAGTHFMSAVNIRF